MKCKRNKPEGLILDVDDYKHRNEHKDLPLAPERYNNRLCITIFDKNEYFVHSINLKYYLKNWMKVTYFSKVISFEQKKYMKQYIDFNTKMRAEVEVILRKDL